MPHKTALNFLFLQCLAYCFARLRCAVRERVDSFPCSRSPKRTGTEQGPEGDWRAPACRSRDAGWTSGHHRHDRKRDAP
ncbi:hypothetical protein BDN70DRAFT_183631 [Pholiota conissans]|uniref:Secreted protein n=1 Tax=Pholiota conissans TaxID=109636 RepID=A0A9P5YV36_9AGAR|nr:hypothetical protein BDN70DRAFT_183631 [Pholiota conissans]